MRHLRLTTLTPLMEAILHRVGSEDLPDGTPVHGGELISARALARRGLISLGGRRGTRRGRSARLTAGGYALLARRDGTAPIAFTAPIIPLRRPRKPKARDEARIEVIEAQREADYQQALEDACVQEAEYQHAMDKLLGEARAEIGGDGNTERNEQSTSTSPDAQCED